MMCKNLNEEATSFSNTAKETRAQLESMTSERNALAGRVDTLGARVELYEDEGVERSRLREEWSHEKAGLLDFVESAIQERDAVIDDLSSRLELAVDTIEHERRQQRLRRQIIFPSSSRPSPPPHPELERRHTGDLSHSSDPSSNGRLHVDLRPNADDLERIHKPKEAARRGQMALQAAMVQSATRKNALRLRVDAMERELVEARAMIDDSKHSQESALAPEMEARGMLIRCISSSVSLGSASRAL